MSFCFKQSVTGVEKHNFLAGLRVNTKPVKYQCILGVTKSCLLLLVTLFKCFRMHGDGKVARNVL